ncbi:MAG: FAD/NAD(P)-binding oxidoreductase [Acidimicrobiia bacterium]|nr:MAG: FAD/NAD(P)-binding oxidoreductase [Acidimicrobiia bacterium]
MSNVKTIVILGGGVGGVVTATTLRKKLPKQHRVIIVDRERDHLFAPSLLWLMVGQRSAHKISRPLERLAKKGIEVTHGEIERIEPEARRVRLVDRTTGSDRGSGRDLDADYLVVSLGAELAPETIPGLEEAGHNFYTLAGAESLGDSLEDFDGGRIVVLTAAPAYKCPAAPYEAAMLIHEFCRKRGIGDRTQVDLYAAEPGPMGVTGPELSAGVRRMVEAKGIGYYPEHQVAEVDSQARRVTFDNGATADFDLLAYVPPHRAPRVVRDSGLVDDSGWVPVDRHTLDTRFPGVYAIGDVTGIPLEVGKPLPMAGVFAEREAVVVAHNVATAITGKGKPERYDGFGECFIETGDGKAGFGRGDFYAQPTPQIKLYKASRRWHIGKVLFEKNWFRRWL